MASNPSALILDLKKASEEFKHQLTVQRVASRYMQALGVGMEQIGTEFPSEESLKKYLHEHPQADKSKHTVKKPGEHKPEKKDEGGGGSGGHGEGGKKEEHESHGGGEDDLEKLLSDKSVMEKVKKAFHELVEEIEEEEITEEAEEEDEEHLKAKMKAADDADMDPKWPAGVPKPMKERFKNLAGKLAKAGESVKKFVTTESAANPDVGKFLQNDDYRRDTLMRAHKALSASPEKIVHRIAKAAVEEGLEMKTASEGIRSLAKGGKLDKRQKKAIKTVALHMALSASVSAVSAAGLTAAGTAGAFGHSLANTIALKAAKKSLGHVNTLNEVHHIGHGLVHALGHLMTAAEGEGEKPDTENAFATLVYTAVLKGMDNLDEEDVMKTLEKAAKGKGDKTARMTGRVSSRYSYGR